jgi:hypothetical protein
MGARKFSLFLAGLIWIAVGLRIGSRGLAWLEPYIKEPDWHLGLLALSVLIGLVKAMTVLKKAVIRNMGNLDKIDDSKFAHFLTGWLILFGKKGSILISLMILLGLGLRYAKENLSADPYNIFGFIYLGIGMGIFGASFFYFQSLKLCNSPKKIS